MTSPADALSLRSSMPSVDPQASLRKHAAEFEGLLLSQILEKLKDCYHLPGEEESDSAGESFQSLANSALGNSLAARDGMGIAKMLVQSLSSNTKGAPSIKDIAPAADVVIKSTKTLKLSHSLSIGKE